MGKKELLMKTFQTANIALDVKRSYSTIALHLTARKRISIRLKYYTINESVKEFSYIVTLNKRVTKVRITYNFFGLT